MTDRNVIHATLAMDRIYPAERHDVFAAFADIEQKRKWYSGATVAEHTMTFRPGGSERIAGETSTGGRFSFSITYFDIIENQRLIYGNDLDFDGGYNAVYLTTIELSDAEGGGTKLKLTEQGAYLDGFDGRKFWQSGTASLLDRLGKHLERKENSTQ